MTQTFQILMRAHVCRPNPNGSYRQSLQTLEVSDIRKLLNVCVRYLKSFLIFDIREGGIMALNAKSTETPLTRRALLGGFGAAAATAALGSGLLGPGDADAQERTRPIPAWIDAARWARSHDGVAVMVNLGTEAHHLQDEIDAGFRAAFRNRFGVQARVFFELEDRRGTVVTYYMRWMVTEPAPALEAATPEAMQHVVEMMRIDDELGPILERRREQIGAAPAPQG